MVSRTLGTYLHDIKHMPSVVEINLASVYVLLQNYIINSKPIEYL